MRFKSENYDRDVDELLLEFVDERVIEAIGDEAIAFQMVGMLLGVSAMDVVEIGEDGYVITPEAPKEIDRRLAIARTYKGRGQTILEAADAGLFESDREAED